LCAQESRRRGDGFEAGRAKRLRGRGSAALASLVLRHLREFSSLKGLSMLALATAAACALAVSSPTPRLDAHAALAPVSVLRAATGERVRLTDEWSSDERAVVVLMRSFG